MEATSFAVVIGSLHHEADAAADPERRHRLGRRGQGDEQVVAMDVLAGQLAPAGIGTLRAGGNVRVLGRQRWQTGHQ